MPVSKKFEIGTKIFAKVKGFVYWPARVNPLPDDVKIPPNKIPIFFYGTHEVYFISPSSCWTYDEKTKHKWGKPKSRAHFNEGMEEIESNPTIYQLGEDENAEDFLCQFYEFVKSNGELNKVNLAEIEDETASRSRHKSGTSENTTTSKDQKSDKPKKRKPSSNKDDDISGSETPSVASDNSEDEDFRPAAKRVKSSQPKPPRAKTPRATPKPKTPKAEDKPKKVVRVSAPRKSIAKSTSKASKKVEDKCDLDSLSSMSSIEDWKAKDDKDKKDLEEQIKKKQIEQVKKEEEVVKEVKKLTRDRKKSSDMKEESDKSKSENDVSDADKIVESVDIKDQKPVSILDKEIVVQISNSDIAMANINNEVNEKCDDIEEFSEKEEKETKPTIAKTIESIDEIKTEVTEEIKDEKNKIVETKDEELQEVKETIEMKSDNEVTEQILISDENEIINKSDQKPHKEKPNQTLQLISDSEDSEAINKSDQKPHKEKPNKTLQLISDSEDSVVVADPMKKTIPKKSTTKLSEGKKNSQKRKRLDSDSEYDEAPKPIQKRQRKTKENKKSRDLNGKIDRKSKEKSPTPIPKLTQVEIFTNCNSDIRTSLRLNHEDYEKCLTNFNSLIEMDIDILELAKTPLTETIKKCRKYKRNEKIMIGAQKVFDKITKLYTTSDPVKVQQVKALIDEQRNQKSQKDEKTEDIEPSSMQSEPATESNNKKLAENVADRVDDKIDDEFDEPKLSIDESVSDMKNKESPKIEGQPKEIGDSEKMKRLNDELEAKANSILFKIEKNAPANLKTLSHLLPQTPNSQIALPVQWQTTKKLSKKDDKDSDEDEEDDEEIFRRIEQVPIKQNETDEVENLTPKVTPKKSPPSYSVHFNSSGKSNANSTLDARIASMIGDSMSSNGSHRSKKSSVSNNRSSRNTDKPKSVSSSIPLSPKSSGNRLSLEPTYKKVPPIAPSTHVTKKEDDSEIYDLLGV